jgi:DNA-binding response OmpR family regulator
MKVKELIERLKELDQEAIVVRNGYEGGVCEVTVSNEVEVALTSTEYQLLELLMRNSGRVISRQQILRDVWNTDWSGSTKNLDMHVSALRRKLGEEGEHISTIRGLGFRFDRT